METLSLAKANLNWTIDKRRHLHQYPELSLEEKDTATFCRQILAELGYTIRDSFGYGFTADLETPGASKRIALRADMDALPIKEENAHDYCSKHDGIAHMCGHDSHMAIALTTAKILIEHKDSLPCHVRFLFQPSEERVPGGAIGMIEQGCLDGVDEVYGLHNDPGTEIGKIRLCEGPLTACADSFSLGIKGIGCHAAKPHDGLDPILCAAELITHWQSFITRHINPAHLAVLSVTQVNAGNAYNVIPDTATLGGTVRTLFPDDKSKIKQLIEGSFAHYREQGFTFTFNYMDGYPPIVNHPHGVKRVTDAAIPVLGESNVDNNTEAAGWGEDFSYFIQNTPGAFFLLGSGNPDKGIVEPLHSPRFDIDEDCLAIGVAVMLNLVLSA